MIGCLNVSSNSFNLQRDNLFITNCNVKVVHRFIIHVLSLEIPAKYKRYTYNISWLEKVQNTGENIQWRIIFDIFNRVGADTFYGRISGCLLKMDRYPANYLLTRYPAL